MANPQNVVRPLVPIPESWVPCVDLFRAHLLGANLADRTVDGYITIIRRLSIDVNKPPQEVTTADLLRRQNRGIAAGSMATERNAYRRFFDIVHDEGLVESNPARKLPKVRVRKGRPRPLSAEQIAAMLNAGPRGAYGTTRAMIILGAYVGMRAHEIAKIRGEMFDLTENTVSYITKGSFERVQPLHPVVRALAERMPRRGWWFPNPTGDGPILAKTVSSRLHHRIRAAGIEDPKLTGHSLRHFFGTELARSGVDIRTIQELMGHELITSTQIYTYVDQSTKSDALGGLPMIDDPLITALAGSAGLRTLSAARERREEAARPVIIEGRRATP